MPTLENTPATTGANIFLEESRVIRAPRARVYEAWTKPEILKTWFGPPNRDTTGVDLDVREDGSYRIDMHVKPEFAATVPHSLATVSGAYTKVIPNELLQFTWEPTWSPGELSLVTITFEDVRGGTQINLRHERFTNEQSRDGHNNGWAGALDKLATVVSEQP